MSSLLVFNRVYRLEIRSVMLVFLTPHRWTPAVKSLYRPVFKNSQHLWIESISYFVHGPAPPKRRNRVSQRTNSIWTHCLQFTRHQGEKWAWLKFWMVVAIAGILWYALTCQPNDGWYWTIQEQEKWLIWSYVRALWRESKVDIEPSGIRNIQLIMSHSAPRPMVRIGPESKDVATKRGITLRTGNFT